MNIDEQQFVIKRKWARLTTHQRVQSSMHDYKTFSTLLAEPTQSSYLPQLTELSNSYTMTIQHIEPPAFHPKIEQQ